MVTKKLVKYVENNNVRNIRILEIGVLKNVTSK